jgi:hypothetical protein
LSGDRRRSKQAVVGERRDRGQGAVIEVPPLLTPSVAGLLAALGVKAGRGIP